jgi:hypothetical protein
MLNFRGLEKCSIWNLFASLFAMSASFLLVKRHDVSLFIELITNCPFFSQDITPARKDAFWPGQLDSFPFSKRNQISNLLNFTICRNLKTCARVLLPKCILWQNIARSWKTFAASSFDPFAFPASDNFLLWNIILHLFRWRHWLMRILIGNHH